MQCDYFWKMKNKLSQLVSMDYIKLNQNQTKWKRKRVFIITGCVCIAVNRKKRNNEQNNLIMKNETIKRRNKKERK